MLPFKLVIPPSRGGNGRRRPRRPAIGMSLTCTQAQSSRLHAAGIKNLALGISDVGPGGVRFVASEPLKAPCHLNLQIRDEASGEMLEATGEVAWVATRRLDGREMYLVGVKFDKILTPPAKCARFFERKAASRPAPPAPKPRAANRFSVSDCDVVLERDHRFRAQESPGNLAHRLLDLSRTGAQVVCTNPLKRGDRVRLTVNLRNFHDIISVEAETVWVRSPRPAEGSGWKVGLAFGTLDHAQQRKLQTLESWFGGAPPGNAL